MRLSLLICLFLLLSAGARGATVMTSATIERIGASYQGYYDLDSTGVVRLTIPPGTAPVTQPLEISLISLAGDESVTTTTAYDPDTTFTIEQDVASCGVGPHYLTAKMPLSGLFRWTYFIRQEPVTPLPTGDATTASLSEKWKQLVLRKMDGFFDEDTSGTWLASNPDADYHWIREDLYYAIALLATDDPVRHERANAMLTALVQAQNRVPASPQNGYFYLNGHDLPGAHNSTTFFCTPVLAWLLLHPPPGLSESTRNEILVALPLAVDAIARRLPVYTLEHTNYRSLGPAALALGGRVLNMENYVNLGRTEMNRWYNHILPQGGTWEYNSPVYNGVTIWGLKMIIEDAEDAQTVAQARILHERFLLDSCLYLHPGMRHMSGPHSRTYQDGLYAGTGLSGFTLALELGQQGYDTMGRIAENMDALHSLDINPLFFQSLLAYPRISEQLAESVRGRTLPASSWQVTALTDTTAYLSPGFTLGTGRQAYHSTHEGFVLQVVEEEFPGNFASVYGRMGATQSEVVTYGNAETPGQYCFSQDNRALLFADLTLDATWGAAKRAYYSLVADERFTSWTDMRINSTPAIEGDTFGLNDVVFGRRANVYLAVQPLYANAVEERARVGVITRGNGHVNISLHAADRSSPLALTGKRVEAGFALYCTEASDWPSYEAFMADYLSGSVVDVDEAPTSRTVEWTLGGETLGCDFSRSVRNFTSRRINGLTLARDMVESEFAVQTAESSVTLRDLSLTGLAPYSWVVYAPNGDTALVVNPSAETVTASSNWQPDALTLPPYSQTVITRPAPSGVEEWRVY